MKKIFLLCAVLLACSVAKGEQITGSVKATDGKAIAGVVVSDGLNTALTDASGTFALEVDKDSRWVFISTPSGYRSSVTGGELGYYRKLVDGVNSYNFLVEKKGVDDINHNIIVFAVCIWPESIRAS